MLTLGMSALSGLAASRIHQPYQPVPNAPSHRPQVHFKPSPASADGLACAILGEGLALQPPVLLLQDALAKFPRAGDHVSYSSPSFDENGPPLPVDILDLTRFTNAVVIARKAPFITP